MITNQRDYVKQTSEFTPDEIDWVVNGLIRLGNLEWFPSMWMEDGTPIVDAPGVESLDAFNKRLKD